jgi:glycosyltransferase involved in cell wall biosynthesis
LPQHSRRWPATGCRAPLSQIIGPADRILVLGSLPLAAPWNGADKVLARTIVTNDVAHRYLIQTGTLEPWPSHVEPIRERRVPVMPGFRAQVMGARYLLSQTRRARLIHVVASIRRPAPGMAVAVRTWARATRRPVVHSIPSLTEEQFQPESLVGNVTVVFSEHTKLLLDAMGVAAVEHIFPPVSMPVTPGADDVERTRAAFDLGSRAVLYAAHLDAGSGAMDAIRAMALLAPELDDATLVLAVRWRPGEDPEVRLAELRAAANDAGIEHRLRVITSVPDMPALIAACAMTVLVPRSLEGKMDLPLVLLESLALGRPIVVSDQPPISETLLGGGMTVAVGDHAALAAALTTLLTDPDRRASLGASGRARLEELADPGRVARAYGRIYDRLLAGGSLGSP